MFVLKLILTLIIIFFVSYNGLALIANNNIPSSEKYIQLMMYIILIAVFFNIVSSFITYYHTKNKVGITGDPGISGSIGNTGDKGVCNTNCGKKVCYKTVIDNANDILLKEYNNIKNKVEGPSPTTTSKNNSNNNSKNNSKTSNLKNTKKNIPLKLCNKDKPTTSSTTKIDTNTNNNTNTNTNTNTNNNSTLPVLEKNDVKIKNEFFLNKINKICNSKNYEEILEKEHKNKPNEKKLIDYISNIVNKWIKLLTNFSIKDENGNIVYLGLNFLLTKEAEPNMLEAYNTETLKSPLDIIKKYDIYNFGENYVMNPIIVEKCIEQNTIPQGPEPNLFVIKTNNYELVYDTNTRKDEWYSSETYCSGDQMGVNNDNPLNLNTCLYYKTNNQGQEYLKGKQLAFKKNENLNKDELSLFHPRKSFINFKDELGNNVKLECYHRDEFGRLYYPVGSVWTAKQNPIRNKANKFTPKTNNKCSGHNTIGPEKETILVSGNVKPPIDYELKWQSKSGCEKCQDDKPIHDISIWRPIPPKGYIALGDYAKIGKEKPVINTENPLDTPIMCVPENCANQISLGPKVWDAKYLIRKEYITDESINKINDSNNNVISKIKQYEKSASNNYKNYKNLYKDDVLSKAPKCNIQCPKGMIKDNINCECVVDDICDIKCEGNTRPNYNSCKCECNIYCDDGSIKDPDNCKCIIDPNSSIILYSGIEFTGNQYKFPLKEASYNHGPDTFPNNKIASIKLPIGWAIQVYIKGNNTGYNRIFKIDKPFLGGNYAYQISSIKIFKNNEDTRQFVTKVLEKPNIVKKDATYFKKKCDDLSLGFKTDENNTYKCFSTAFRPNIYESSPLQIYSAGATDASEEFSNRNGLQINDDGGHNLFIVTNNEYEKPKAAYKIDKNCLNNPKPKPINTEPIPGILDIAVGNNRPNYMKAEKYFTFPRTAFIKNISSLYSHNGEPKTYYITYSNKTINKNYNGIKVKTPLYYIRAYNKRLNDFSNCVIVNDNGKIVFGDINSYANNANSLWIIENSSNKAFFNNTDYHNQKVLLTSYGYKDMQNNSVYFHQYFNELGVSHTMVKSYINLDDTNNHTWIYKNIAQ